MESLGGRHGVVHETHSAWGNPNRFETGPVTLRLDAVDLTHRSISLSLASLALDSRERPA